MKRLTAVLAGAVLLCAASASAYGSQMTVDLSKPGVPLKKGGLGTLFGITTIAGGTPANLINGTILHITASQGLPSQNGSNPYSTDSIAPLIRGKGIGLMCRLNDLLLGFPYQWQGLATWDSDVTAAIDVITQNYPDVVYGVEVFNEPDEQLNDTAFNTDPMVMGSTYTDRINWLWTHTVQEIRHQSKFEADGAQLSQLSARERRRRRPGKDAGVSRKCHCDRHAQYHRLAQPAYQ